MISTRLHTGPDQSDLWNWCSGVAAELWVFPRGMSIASLNKRWCVCSLTRKGFYASAQLYMDDVVAMDSIESIQAILCCAMYSLRSPIGVSVW